MTAQLATAVVIQDTAVKTINQIAIKGVIKQAKCENVFGPVAY